MKKIGIFLLSTGLIVLFTVAVTMGILGSQARESACRFYFTSDIEVRDGEVFLDGEAGPAIREFAFMLSQDAEYGLHVSWREDPENAKGYGEPGFVTLLVFKDAQGNVIAYDSADQTDGNLDVGSLEAGDYVAEYRFFADETELRHALIGLGQDIASENRGSFNGFDRFGQSGVWSFEFAFELEDAAHIGYRAGYLGGLAFGLVIVLFLGVMILLLTKKDGKMKNQYDERQEMFRGRAFKYAFITMMVYDLLLIILETAKVDLPMDTTAKIFMGISVAIVPFGCYSIWKDAYFSMNDKKKNVIILFVVIGIMDFASGIGNLAYGTAVVDGRLTFNSMPLAIGVDMMILSATALIKSVNDRKDEIA